MPANKHGNTLTLRLIARLTHTPPQNQHHTAFIDAINGAHDERNGSLGKSTLTPIAMQYVRLGSCNEPCSDVDTDDRA